MPTAEVQAPALAGLAGLVFYRLEPVRFKDRQERGQVLARMREGWEPPPFGAEAWKRAGGKWSYDFGGRRVPAGGRLTWEWSR